MCCCAYLRYSYIIKVTMFFKKKKETATPAIKMKTIICIPGIWKDRSDLVSSIFNNNANEFIFSGNVLLNMNTQQQFEIEVCDHDERMANSFKVAGMANRLDDSFLGEIEKHNTVIYLIGEGGSLEKAEAIAKAAQAIINAGGRGVKVETAGKAFTKEQWTSLIAGKPQSNLYKMFVLDSITEIETETVFSCGMHNLGLKDTIVSRTTLEESLDMISIFSYYQIVDKPVIRHGKTFSKAADSPIYQILEEPSPPYSGMELFENPYGMWRLQRKIS